MTDPIPGADVPLALFAGLVSFLSPCVLPLVPGYLSTVNGISPAEIEGAGWRRVLLPSLLFVASFSVIFILLGLTATGVGELLRENRQALNRVAGVLIVLMGALFVASAFSSRLGGSWHVEALASRARKGGPVLAGAAFAIAWTPCVGPTLAGILTLASLQESVGRGAFLMGVYSAGLAIPFIATALAFSRMTTAFEAVKRHYAAIILTGGLVLVAMGILVFTGELFQLNVSAQRFLDRFGLNFFADV